MTSIANSLEQFRRLNERHRRQIEAITRPAKEISRLAEKLRIPAVKLSPKFTASMKASQAIVDQFAAIRVPAIKQYDEMAEALARAQPLAPRTIPDFDNRPAHFHHRGLESISTITRDPPVVPRTSPAQDVLTRVNEQFQSQKKLEEDQRHTVVIEVTLLTGKRLCAPSMCADGDHLIRIVGEDSRNERHEVVVGFASFQYEILTIELPPPGPDLRIV